MIYINSIYHLFQKCKGRAKRHFITEPRSQVDSASVPSAGQGTQDKKVIRLGQRRRF